MLSSAIIWWTSLPPSLFDAPLAAHLLASDGSLLSAHIATDGQWRMAPSDSISSRVKAAVVCYEDRRFYGHYGIDGRAILRAALENMRAGRVASGGSTLSMQVARLASAGGRRTLARKLWECVRATRLEASYSKDDILEMWLNNAPFGGNQVGITAACFRYYGRSPANLSWAEAATLAVLPNAPALIHPGRNRRQLYRKRNALLATLLNYEQLDSTAYTLALLERIPESPVPLKRSAAHYLDRLRLQRGNRGFTSTLHAELQEASAEVVVDHHRRLRQNEIYNIAVRISEVATADIVAYHGNVPYTVATDRQDVDILTSLRSPGSLLKPLLYAASLDAGLIQTASYLPDVPTQIAGFRPTNFDDSYSGAVAANEALQRSLNIPFVQLLRNYGVEKFHEQLRTAGFSSLSKPSGHYGLSLILGGGEIRHDEIHDWFLHSAQQLMTYDSLHQAGRPTDLAGISAGATYLTFDQLRYLNRPRSERSYGRRSPASLAWKTGTSFGFRDAWAVGTTPDYTISVWVGNADGTGRPGLVGVEAAAPILFDLLKVLRQSGMDSASWFPIPYDEVIRSPVCYRSGGLPGPDCPIDSTLQLVGGGAVCAYHERHTVNASGSRRTTLSCDPNARAEKYFVLPPLQAYFYRKQQAYLPLPPRDDCSAQSGAAAGLRLVYPQSDGRLQASRNWRGAVEPFFFQVASAEQDAELYWHMDGNFMQTTREVHALDIHLDAGKHELHLQSDQGGQLTFTFEVSE